MSFTSDLLAMTLQDLNDNPDTWGDVLNNSVLELLEDSFDTTTIDVTSADGTLDATVGGDVASHYRYGIINITGTALAVPRNVNVPVDSFANFPQKMWLVVNNTTGGQVITFKTTTGAGVAIPAATAQFCYCDGTDILGTNAETATLAATATSAVDADALGGIAAANYVQNASANTWTAGQVTQRLTMADDLAGTITADIALSNTFFHEMTGGENLAAPLNPTNGAQFSLVVEQGTGAPHTLTFQASTFVWESGVAPTLSTGVGDVDYLAFEYVTNTAFGNRWIGSILKGVS